ncbi:hypothetical protein BR93DRAFT_935133 [Coniochaeta sp. PMI_546]|nr:hypothetical protein BR93DRAFT_935133 [Coniochaeta sp. PMI_546]
MHSLVAFFSVLVGLSSVQAGTVASVINRQSGDLPRGWCCVPGCDICQAGARCQPPDYDQCNGLFVTNTCCMLERKVDAEGVDKLYTSITGKEVKFVSEGDEMTA